MSASTSFTVALVLTATNRMSSILNSAGSSLGTFGSQIVKCANEVSKYDRQIGALEERIRKYDNLKSRGLQDIQNGMIMSVPVEEALRYAGTFETVMTKVNNAIYDSTVPLTMQQQIMKKLEKQAIELGNATTFSNVQAAEAQLALIRNGMTYRDVLNGGATAAMFLAQTAEIAPSTAADAVSQITNMFQLQGRQLLKVADDINRAANASSAGVTNLMHDLQQTGLSAHTLGLQVKETALMLGTLHNMGLGDASGTYLNDMLINLDKVTPKARSAMQAMGWLEGATVKTLSSGRIKVTGGTNSLFDEQGQIRSAELLVKKLRQVLFFNSGLKPADMRDKQGNLLPQEEIERIMQAKNKLESLQQFKDVFGIQGMRSAIALATPGKGSYEEMVAQAERAKRIQDQVMAWQDTLFGKLEQLKGTYETLMTQTGSPLTNEVGGLVTRITGAVKAVGDWANANPKLASSIIQIIGLGAATKISWGAMKVVWSTVGGSASVTAKVLTTAARSAHGFYDSFKYFRQGTGIFRSLWSAVAFGHPTLTKVLTITGRLGSGFVSLAVKALKGGGTVLATVARMGLGFLTMGARALIAGARMAAAWLIGLGPLGWAILGISAIVAAAVAAWKTNFKGFRDYVIGVIEKIVGWVNKLRRALKLDPITLDIIEKKKTSMTSFRQLDNKSASSLSKQAAAQNAVSWLPGSYQSGVASVIPYSSGGIITSPHLGLVGEAGPEAIIPLRSSSGVREKALAIYAQVGKILGVLPAPNHNVMSTASKVVNINSARSSSSQLTQDSIKTANYISKQSTKISPVYANTFNTKAVSDSANKVINISAFRRNSNLMQASSQTADYISNRNISTSPLYNATITNIRAYAAGGIITSPHLGLVGEAGPEAIIPLRSSSGVREKALAIYAQVGKILGVQPAINQSVINSAQKVFNISSTGTKLTMGGSRIVAYASGGIIGSVSRYAAQTALALNGTDAHPKAVYMSVSDRRTYIFNIRSTDPKEAAAEVSRVVGGPRPGNGLPMDKYQRSRDPRFNKFGLD